MFDDGDRLRHSFSLTARNTKRNARNNRLWIGGRRREFWAGYSEDSSRSVSIRWVLSLVGFCFLCGKTKPSKLSTILKLVDRNLFVTMDANSVLSMSNQTLVVKQEAGVRNDVAVSGRATCRCSAYPAPSTAIDGTIVIEPSILYFGTPVVLTGTTNEDGSPNLAPISCVWWLGWSCVLGLDISSKTTINLERERQCVLNLPSAQLVGAVDRLACLTGSSQMPVHKIKMGYRYEPNKFKVAGLTPVASDVVKAPRAKECPVQLEAVVESIRPFGENDRNRPFPAVAIEMRVVRVHVHKSLVVNGKPNRVDPEKWRPLITSFRQYFGLGSALHPSKFSEFPEETFAPNRFQPERGSLDSVDTDSLAA